MKDSILHVETRHRRGGAERNLNHFADWQASRGHRAALAVGRDSLVDAVPGSVDVIVVGSLVRAIDPIRDIRAVVELRNLIRHQRFDVVHTHQSKAGVVGRVAAHRVARLVLHTVHMVSFGPGYGVVGSAGFSRAEKVCARWTDEMVAVGEELRTTYLSAGIGSPDRFRVIRSPIEVGTFLAVRAWSLDERASARADLGVSGHTPMVLVVSALEPRKRVGLILEQLSPQLRQGWRLVVAGDGAERPKLQSMADSLGISKQVAFLGQQDSIPRLMGAADVLAHAAEAEGVPQVAIQALAAGLPIAATDVMGLREVPASPILIAASDGSDLAALVRRQVDERPTPVTEEALKPWSRESVEEAIGRLHADLGIA